MEQYPKKKKNSDTDDDLDYGYMHLCVIVALIVIFIFGIGGICGFVINTLVVANSPILWLLAIAVIIILLS